MSKYTVYTAEGKIVHGPENDAGWAYDNMDMKDYLKVNNPDDLRFPWYRIIRGRGTQYWETVKTEELPDVLRLIELLTE